MALKEEILIIDSNNEDRIGMERLFTQEGYLVTAFGDSRKAKDLIKSKFFRVIIVDSEVEPENCFELINYIKMRSNATEIILLTVVKSFEAVIKGFRAGVLDVILKRPDQVGRLKQKVAGVLIKDKHGDNQDILLGEANKILDEFFHKMILIFSELPATKNQLEAQQHQTKAIMVEPDINLAQKLSFLMKNTITFQIYSTAGELLDKMDRIECQIAVVNENLPDFSGMMLVNSFESRLPNLRSLVYDLNSGKMKHIQNGEVKEEFIISKDNFVKILTEFSSVGVSADKERKLFYLLKNEYPDFVHKFLEIKNKITQYIEKK